MKKKYIKLESFVPFVFNYRLLIASCLVDYPQS